MDLFPTFDQHTALHLARRYDQYEHECRYEFDDKGAEKWAHRAQQYWALYRALSTEDDDLPF